MMTTSFQATMQLLIMIMGNYSLLNSTVTNGSTCTDNKKESNVPFLWPLQTSWKA